MVKTGIGFDIHRLVSNRALVLGGVSIEHKTGLAGHSDGDVLSHAVADALLGAVTDGDIGTHFPDTDSRWKDVRSLELLPMVITRLANKHAHVLHIDATIIAEQPKIAPYRSSMQINLARALNVLPECVSIKATTAE